MAAGTETGGRSRTENHGKAAGRNGFISGRKQQIRKNVIIIIKNNKINQAQRCKAEAKGKQEGEAVKALGFSQAGVLSQAGGATAFSTPKRGKCPKRPKFPISGVAEPGGEALGWHRLCVGAGKG